MPAILKALKPTGFVILVLALVLVLQAVFFNDGHFSICAPKENQPGTSTTTWHFEFGLGKPVVLNGDCGRRSIHIRWIILLINLMLSYGLAVLADRGIRKTSRLQRPALLYLSIMAVICLMAFFTSVTLSRIYWGYWFVRPSLPREVHRLVRVKALIPVDTKREGDNDPLFVVRNDFSLPEMMAWCQAYPYEYPNYRILLYLKKKGLLPDGASREIGTLNGLYARIPKKYPAEPKKGYEDSWKLRGLIVDGDDAAGNRMVIITVMGREVSNDHYPVYDFLFQGTGPDRSLSFKRGRRFYHDIAGYEGLEWYVMWCIFSFFGILAGLPLFTIGLIVTKSLTKPQKI